MASRDDSRAIYYKLTVCCFAVRDLVSLKSHETFCGDPDRGIPHNVSFDTSFVKNVSDNNIIIFLLCYFVFLTAALLNFSQCMVDSHNA